MSGIASVTRHSARYQTRLPTVAGSSSPGWRNASVSRSAAAARIASASGPGWCAVQSFTASSAAGLRQPVVAGRPMRSAQRSAASCPPAASQPPSSSVTTSPKSCSSVTRPARCRSAGAASGPPSCDSPGDVDLRPAPPVLLRGRSAALGHDRSEAGRAAPPPAPARAPPSGRRPRRNPAARGRLLNRSPRARRASGPHRPARPQAKRCHACPHCGRWPRSRDGGDGRGPQPTGASRRVACWARAAAPPRFSSRRCRAGRGWR